ncbi:HlyC/CorC family transporter [Nocardioides mangrovicus]|uniref:HlyC/CorC family transporter n=1 Tax=Nocardioides mangrovicus TaxID=2478913 RepID=A0A3L8P0N8_9ACTN|nr:hemolysin family protein [Nocardioides mangrovicus]RLV49015.1 HlyC/CorC family transporter [Nocardioides mangrovicus]
MSSQTALLVGVVLLLTNAFFVAGEFALVSARRTQIEPKAAAGNRLARTTLRAMDNVSQVMAAVQLGITVASLALGAIAEPALSHVLEPLFDAVHLPEGMAHPVSFAIALGVVTYFHVVLGEMVPKNIALAGPERAAMVLGTPMMAFVTLFKPVVVALNAAADGVVRLVRLEPASAVASTFTKEEVEALVDESRDEGLLADDEYERLSGALGFTTREVSSVLLPLEELETVPVGARVGDVERICAETGYSRFPVVDDTPEGPALVGYLHIKDVLETDPHGRTRVVQDKWIRPFANVRPTDTLQTALAVIQAKGSHLARVVDDAGTVLGIVTLEDVIEELVGEIRDASHTS